MRPVVSVAMASLLLLAGNRLAAAEVGAKVIRLEDVVAGGDGSGNAPPENVGIDPRSGLFTTGYFDGRIFETDGVNPAAVPDSPYINSVFLLKGQVPTAEDGCSGCFVQRITQSGIQLWLDDSEETTSGWNFILKDRAGGVSGPGLRIGGRDYFTTAIGLHASMGITFDLEELRRRHGNAAVGCFSAFWGMDDCSSGFVKLLAMVANDSFVVESSIRAGFFSAGQGELLQIELPRDARYLTLVSSALGADSCDHGTFARPVITPLPCPETPDAWLWGFWPWRVRPEGEAVIVDGEALFDGYSIHVGGAPLLDQAYLSDTRRAGVTPRLAPGIHDAEVVFDGTVILRLPGALEVAAPPVLSLVAPAKALFDRTTPALLHGKNLRADMTVLVEDVGTGDGGDPLIGQQLRSAELIAGSLPRLDRSTNALGPKTIVLLDQERRRSFPGLLTYADVGIEKVEPDIVSTRGGTDAMFVGTGFQAGMSFHIGSQPMTAVEVLDSGHVRGRSPPIAAGSHAAELRGTKGQLLCRLPGAFTAVVPAPLAIASVTPARVFSLGGAEVKVVTTVPHGGATPRAGGILLVNAAAVDGLTLRGEVPSLAPGSHDVDLVDEAGKVVASAPGALQVLSDNQIDIRAVSPRTVSTLGGTEVTITGSGFSPDFVPRLGGTPLTDVVLTGTTSLRGVSPPLEPGTKNATLTSGQLTLDTLPGAVNAEPPAVPPGMHIGQVRPARITGDSPIRFIGVDIPDDVVPRIGGVALQGFRAVSSCRVEGTLGGGGGGGEGGGAGAPSLLPPGFYTADLFRPGFGIVAELDGLVEVAAPGAAPRPTHVVSAPVLPDGSTRLFVFGNDFAPETRVLVGGKPLTGLTVVSDELIVGNAPALAPGADTGLRDIRAEDSRGGATLLNGIRYVEPEPAVETEFVRGDPNANGRPDLSDAVYVLGFLFLGNPTAIACRDSADVDANGKIDLSDAVYLLQYLFLGGREPPRPFPACGQPKTERLGCGSFAGCGGGGAGAAAPFSLQDNVKLLAEAPASRLDPMVVELAAEEGEIVLRDPPGGQEVRPGDVITGFTPFHLDAVHQGVAYMLKVERAVAGSCLAAGKDEKVFKVTPATLKDVMRSGVLTYKQSDFFGAKVFRGKPTLTGGCNLVSDFGAGGGQVGGCVSDCTSIDFDMPPFDVVNLNHGDSYLRAGFKRCKVLYNSGTELGVEFSEDGVDRTRFFSGVRFDSEVEFYVDAHAHEQIHKEASLAKYQKSTIIFIGFPPVLIPILLTVEAELFAGVDMEAGIDMYADAGSRAHFKAGLGFEFDGERVRNTSTIDLPTIAPLPGTPELNIEGFVSVKGYVRPQLRFFGGLAVAVLTGNLRVFPEFFTRAHASGSTDPPCFRYGLDAGARLDVHPEIQFLGWDLWDPPEPLKLIDEEWTDLVSGEIGCKKPPVVKLTRRLEQLGPLGQQLHVHLDASGSQDPDGGPLNYRWDFDNDGVCDRNTGPDPRTTYIFDPAAGSPCRLDYCTHHIRLRVTDDEKTYTEATTSFATQGSGLLQGVKPRLP